MPLGKIGEELIHNYELIYMKILVTGNMGYIGPIVVSVLRKNFPNCVIKGMDSGFFAHCLLDSNDAFPEINIDEQIFLDIRDIQQIHLEGVDAVIHLASISNDPMGSTYESQTWDINSLASFRLAQIAKEVGVTSFVFASSCSIYGQGSDNPRSEMDNLNPLTTYAKSKVFLESALKNLADNNFRVTCLRFATACGWSPRCRFDLVINDFVLSAMAIGEISVLSDGTPWRPMIHVKDMAKALAWGVSRSIGEDYLVVNVGENKNNYQVKELAQIVASVIPNTKISIAKDSGVDSRSYRVNFDLFEKLTGHGFIEWSVHKAAEELFAKLNKIKFSDNNFRNSRYIRFNVLKDLQAREILNADLRWTSS